jgi:hypothetical protein
VRTEKNRTQKLTFKLRALVKQDLVLKLLVWEWRDPRHNRSRIWEDGSLRLAQAKLARPHSHPLKRWMGWHMLVIPVM